ncbi:MAG: alpha/beta hydrolase [Balneolaceae bacterium]|nr:alpha/beta hydrolase [Balneolaceae bacterium]MDR9407583.1 alpha/beta hydrolase [Balneolaceae bacterium]
MNPNFFETKKGKLAWYSTGTGKPLLHLHGWGSDSKVMMPMAKQLQDVRKSYLVDFPGFGNSPEPTSAWGIDDFADIIESFVDEKFQETSFDLIVHSFGARIAIKLLTRPRVSSKIDKVVFTGAAGLKPKRSISFYLKKYTAKTLKLTFNLLPTNLREKGLKNLRETALWKSLGSSDYQRLSGVMRETFVACVNDHLDHLVPQINHEVLLIWGTSDVATPLEQGKRFNTLLQESALIEIEGGGHYAFLDKPKQFASILRAYFEPGEKS